MSNYVTLGDVGYLDEDGYLFLCDRKIDMIVSGVSTSTPPRSRRRFSPTPLSGMLP